MNFLFPLVKFSSSHDSKNQRRDKTFSFFLCCHLILSYPDRDSLLNNIFPIQNLDWQCSRILFIIVSTVILHDSSRHNKISFCWFFETYRQQHLSDSIQVIHRDVFCEPASFCITFVSPLVFLEIFSTFIKNSFLFDFYLENYSFFYFPVFWIICEFFLSIFFVLFKLLLKCITFC